MIDNRMFDFAEYYSKVANQLPDNCRIAEVGVADGASVIFMAKELLRLKKIFKIYAVDNMEYGGYLQMKTIYENLIAESVAKYVEVVPHDSLIAATLFNDGFLDMAFIDSSHTYSQTVLEIPVWYNKVKDGGILGGHDYFGHDGVKQAVDEKIPKTIIRKDIPHRKFEPEQFLQLENTSNNYGVWWVKKDFYKKLNL